MGQLGALRQGQVPPLVRLEEGLVARGRQPLEQGVQGGRGDQGQGGLEGEGQGGQHVAQARWWGGGRGVGASAKGDG